MTGPTHEKGHTLDLVLSHGPSVCVGEICNTCISDHTPVLHTVTVPGLMDKSDTFTCHQRVINPSTASPFSAVFKDSFLFSMLDGSCVPSAEELTKKFDTTCTEILDCVALLGYKRTKTLGGPGLNDTTRALRHFCMIPCCSGSFRADCCLRHFWPHDSTTVTCLEQCVGIKGNVPKWFQSHLTARSFAVHLGEYFSSPAPLSCGLPQDSIWGLILFSFYMLPLGPIFKKHNISFHCFADDIQIYIPIKANTKDSIQPLLQCKNDIKSWMKLNFLYLTENNTEIAVFGRLDQTDNCIHSPDPLASLVCSSAKNLGGINSMF